MKEIIFFINYQYTIISCKTDSTFSSISIPSKKSAATTKPKTAAKEEKLLNVFFANIQGNYSSKNQSKNQSKIDKTYYYITLGMTPIWKTKGKCLYVCGTSVVK